MISEQPEYFLILRDLSNWPTENYIGEPIYIIFLIGFRFILFSFFRSFFQDSEQITDSDNSGETLKYFSIRLFFNELGIFIKDGDIHLKGMKFLKNAI